VADRKVEYVDEDRDGPTLRALPKGTRVAIGKDLRRLQNGDPAEKLQQCRPLTEFGKGVVELKRGAWRTVLSTVVDPVCIWIVCVFRKNAREGNKMRKEHKTLIEASLKKLMAWLEPPSKRPH
jgi:phage-related protein